MTGEESPPPVLPVPAPPQSQPETQQQPSSSTSDVMHLYTNESPHLVTFLKIVIVALFLYPLVHYAFYERNNAEMLTDGDDSSEVAAVEDQITEPPVVKVRIRKPQPTCPIAYLQVILLDICQDLYIKYEQCTPEDVNDPEKHKLPLPPRIAKNATTGEPRGTIVGCIAAGLLMTSLGAAFVELYKAKSGGGKTSKTKPPMSRKCSLADLTVLKHNRKELVRKESILELPEAALHGSTQQLVLFSPPPLYRRSSFPVNPSPSEVVYDVFEYRRTSLMEPMRRLSIIDSHSRRSSMENRKTSIDVSRRISMDESPERRHYTRLVHRH